MPHTCTLGDRVLRWFAADVEDQLDGHFPDQQSLLQAVARHALERSIAAGESVLAEEADSLEALPRYMHAAIDHGIGVVTVIYPLLDKPHPDLRARAGSMVRVPEILSEFFSGDLVRLRLCLKPLVGFEPQMLGAD